MSDAFETAMKAGGFRATARELKKYSDIKKCTFKKEAGIEDESCKKMWKELNIDEAG